MILGGQGILKRLCAQRRLSFFGMQKIGIGYNCSNLEDFVCECTPVANPISDRVGPPVFDRLPLCGQLGNGDRVSPLCAPLFGNSL